MARYVKGINILNMYQFCANSKKVTFLIFIWLDLEFSIFHITQYYWDTAIYGPVSPIKKVVEGKTLHGMCVTKSSHTQLDLSLERFDMICR